VKEDYEMVVERDDGDDVPRKEVEVIGRMRWNFETGEGEYLSDGNNVTLQQHMDPMWEETTDKQRLCGWWESHVPVGTECILCRAVKLR
jgi:hypothetical protein